MHYWQKFFICELLLLSFFSGCVHKHKSVKSTVKTYSTARYASYNAVGTASWYGKKYHKKRTASGQLFDKNKISGAHKDLPLPCVFHVTNLENGKSLQVLINDRGPFVSGRIIDLSEKAAQKLGFKEKGLAKVRIAFDQKATQRLWQKQKLRFT